MVTSDYDSEWVPRHCSTIGGDDGEHFTVCVYGKTFGDYRIALSDEGLTKITCDVCGESSEDYEGFDPTDLPHAPDCPWIERYKLHDSKD